MISQARRVGDGKLDNMPASEAKLRTLATVIGGAVMTVDVESDGTATIGMCEPETRQ